MRVVTLVENTSVSQAYKAKHGLSLYIETKKHKLLFDLGPGKTFLENAEKLHIDITSIDTVIISHGHVDHGGALELFMQHNTKAKIYIQRSAFEGHYTKVLGIPIPVGLKKSFTQERIIFVDQQLEIDDELILFNDVKDKELMSESNKALYMRVGRTLHLDTFEHEQNLIIRERSKVILIAGCAHRGIINIKKQAEEIIEKRLDYVISGFHLYNPVSRKCEKDSLVQEIGNHLKETEVQYFTCHCTGNRAFSILQEVMGEQIKYLATGSELEI